MKGIKLISLDSFFMIILFSNCNEPKSAILLNKLEGVWGIVEIKNELRDSTHNIKNPQPGIWIFSDG
jgi:hypothetical protein